MVRLIEGRHHDPFSILGRRRQGGMDRFFAFNPDAECMFLGDAQCPMARIENTGLFACTLPKDEIPARYAIHWTNQSGHRQSALDPYCFPPQIPDFDIHLFGEGRHWHVYRVLGAHCVSIDQYPGVLFAVWAPNAERVSVVGDFNGWDGRRHPMRVRGASGIWELFIPGLEAGTLSTLSYLQGANARAWLEEQGVQFWVT